MKMKNYLLFIAFLLLVSGVFVTSGKSFEFISKSMVTSKGNATDTFVVGGFSSVTEGITTYKKFKNRYCSIKPIDEGIYVFKGHLRITAALRVKKVIQPSTNTISFEVYGSVTSRSVEYNEKKDITTIEIQSKEPFVLSLGKANDEDFKKKEFELISYSPLEKNDIYKVHTQSINPCEKSSMIIKYYEPTMVVADDGTIIIAAYCEQADGIRKVLNTVSRDGGETWKTNWSSGILSMTWDRINHRLCGIKSGKSYISYDYGMSWRQIGTYDNSFVTDDMNAYCLQLKKEEKRAYEKKHPIQRYSYHAYTVNTGNSGIQLENGVICMPMLIRLKKSLAGKDNKGNWIKDADGYCLLVNTKSNGIERVVAYVIYSKDFGVTWEHSPTTHSDIICEETCLTEVLPNQVCMNSRGGTESYWSKKTSVRRVFIQHTPVDNRDSFTIDRWDADWGTRSSNTIEDALVNADIEKVKIKSKDKDLSFWLFCNIYNPGSFVRKGLMLRLSTDCRNWVNVGYLTPSNKIIGGYCELGTYDSHIYLVYEGNRDSDPLSFIRLDNDYKNEILSAYESSLKKRK